MKLFDILDPHLDLHQKFFIEASAGCGKTFSIEHAYVRLIIDPKQKFNVENILVLTFTREATFELRERIRLNLQKAKDDLEANSQDSVEYIKHLFNLASDEKKIILRSLKRAITTFANSQIFTIHKFCYSKLSQFMFDAKLNLSKDVEKSEVSLDTFKQVIRDYLAFYYDPKKISLGQFKHLLSSHKNDIEYLIHLCATLIAKEMQIVQPKNFEEIVELCLNEIEQIKNQHKLSEETVYEYFVTHAPFFKGTTNKNKQIDTQVLQLITHISKLFGMEKQSIIDDLVLDSYSEFCQIFSFDNLKKSVLKQANELDFSYLEILQRTLLPLLRELTAKDNLLLLLASECQKLLKTYYEEKQVLTPNNILTRFHELIQNPKVRDSISSEYQALIIDEFQDTDPLQWEILSSIFLKNRGSEMPIYLVGDPKQSIYAFRNADLYTYLKAAESLGVSSPHELRTNFRSQPKLISALNHLFESHNNRWLELPKLNSHLPYKPVISSNRVASIEFNDDRKSIHYILSKTTKKTSFQELEEEIFFPFIINEILRLHNTQNVALNSFAVLIKDRYQGSRLKEYFKKYQIPYVSLRSEPLQDSDIILHFLHIFLAALHPKSTKQIYLLKLNSLLNWPSSIFELNNLPTLFNYFADLKNLLFSKGFLAFYDRLMMESKLQSISIYQRVLAQKEGLYLYQELEQLKDILLQKELEGANPYQLVEFLENICESSRFDTQPHALKSNVENIGVQLLTMHMSKGLEFDIVFALGLACPVKNSEEPIFDRSKNALLPLDALSYEESEKYLKEQDAEKMRTLYVALTRAKQRLYIPCVFGEALSPTSLFFEKLGLDYETLQEYLSQQEDMSYSLCYEKITVVSQIKEPHHSLVAPIEPSIVYKNRYKHSFSSLATSVSHSLTELKAPHDFTCSLKTIHTLPAGSATGVLIHYILENIYFDDPLINLDSFLKNTEFEHWAEVIEQQISKLLITPINIGDENFSLSQIARDQIYKEIEFLYPTTEPTLLEEMQRQGDFLHGYIDLVFMFNNRYYVVDYKSNWLGTDADAYLNLTPVMHQHQYFLQASIYREALKKYIEMIDKRPFDECFGGVIYWFVRGLEADNRGIILV